MKIAVAVGHTLSGADTGAVGILNEGICTREIADKVKTKLEALGHTVVFCRIDGASSVNDALAYKVNLANNAGVDVYAEIHLNSGGGVGVETYCYALGGQAEKYAGKVQDALVKLGYRNRGVKTANFYVLRNTDAPAILVECGFVDSREDCNRYNPDLIANAIVRGLTGREPVVPKPTPAPVQNKVIYRVQVGAYSIKANADKLQAELKSKGIDCFVKQINGLYKVQCGAYSVRANADAMSNRLKALGYSCFITQ
jgi:N-acetylmuramoyl-L-alanine amidase